ncbi:MAG: hypothetical protein NT108_02400 [Candidatus Kaiserbacteria bacterium]|nr:hypothetical protein [Candidatus Kaiserbacteria bacterium]
MQNSRIKSLATPLAVLLGIIGMIAGAVALNSNSTALSGRTNREIALACTSDMATQFHIHPHLEILINGEQQSIPANIGVKPACMNALHTHDASGTLHVESPEKRDFTLGDFFAVWGQTFSKDQVLQSMIGETHHIRVTVNGVEVDTYENTILHDKDRIVISYE